MTNQAATFPDADAQRRWDQWRAKGAEGDRLTAAKMRIFMLLVVIALAVWFAVHIA